MPVTRAEVGVDFCAVEQDRCQRPTVESVATSLKYVSPSSSPTEEIIAQLHARRRRPLVTLRWNLRAPSISAECERLAAVLTVRRPHN